MEFEPVIGLEVHAQLSTASKIFCSCKAKLDLDASVADEAVNQNTCPVCAAHPGTLPVLNRQAYLLAIRAGLALHCRINSKNVFSRKNYFYPDLPKGYQISQFDLPICEEGHISIEAPNGEMKKVRVQRIHMEEDAGKNVHLSGFSLVNLNRAGIPLIEIVSHPDIRSSEEAVQYLKALHAIVTQLGVCDGNMQEGNFRCDANVSVRPKGSTEFGTRAEIKNLNSFRFLEKAVEFEIARQIEVIQSGGKVILETRGYDSAKNSTFSLRSKEEAHDYRYFPEPDLLPLQIETATIEEVRSKMPELPEDRKNRYMKSFGLSKYDAGVLTASVALSAFFESVLSKLKGAGDLGQGAKLASNLLSGEVSRLVNETQKEISQSKLEPKHLSDLVSYLVKGDLSSTAAKTALLEAWETGRQIETIVRDKGLIQVNDASALEGFIQQVIAQNPTQTAEYRGGKEKLLGFFVGQVMKVSGGKANPAIVTEMVKKFLKQ